jgi:hypothetical protein
MAQAAQDHINRMEDFIEFHSNERGENQDLMKKEDYQSKMQRIRDRIKQKQETIKKLQGDQPQDLKGDKS